MKKISVAFLLFLFLSACTMAPKYKQPEIPVVDQWPVAIQGDEEKAISEIKWQMFFQSSTLQKVIKITLENNSNLKEATLKIDAARALYRIKNGDLYPKIAAEGSGSRKNIPEKASSTGKEHITSTYDANLNTSYELDFFGRIRSLNDAALEDFLSTQEARNAIQVSLIAEVANAYLLWLSDTKLFNISNETFKIQEQLLNLVSKSYEVGNATKMDFLQAKTLVETAKANLAVASRRVAQDKNALVLLMGKDNDVVFASGQVLEGVVLEQNLPIGLPSAVLLVRPDVKSAEHQLKSMNANIGVARAAYFPKISLTAAYGFSSTSLSSLFSGGAIGAWNFAPKITAPIFEIGSNKAGLAYAKTKKEIAIVQYERSIKAAFKEVADELVARQSIAEQLEAQKQLLVTSQMAYDLAKSRYENGITRFFSVLEAARSLFNAQQGAVEIEKLRLINFVNLYKVLGGGQE